MKSKTSPIKSIVLLLFLAAVLAVGIFAYRRYMPTSEKADMTQIYDSEENKVTLFLNYEKQSATGIYENQQTYVPISWVNENLNERFYWDANEKLLVYALPDKIVYADANAVSSSGAKLLLEKEDGVYLFLGLILNYTDLRMSVYDNGDFKRVYVENTWDAVPVATVKWDGKLRQKGGIKSPVITEVSKGENIVVLEILDKWIKAMAPDGHIGYLYAVKAENIREETPVSTFEAPVYKNISLDKKISMAWHQVTIPAANDSLSQLLAATKGLNVIAPTWYTLSDNQGGYESAASKAYVDKAHEQGVQVWAVLDNFSRESSKNVQTEVALAKTSVRKLLIAKLMDEAAQYGFDGINLDFESLQEAAGVHYVQFIRELSVACREKGLVLSVDNYVPAPYNRYYNRKEQGIVADYVIIMGYDEHYPGGEAGSVASRSYVEKGIADTLELVPKEKVINGVPFYTRIWTQNGDQSSSKALGIAGAAQWAQDNGVNMQWQEELGQYYGEKTTDEGLNRLWLEDATSLGIKMDLIKKYDLAGVAGWKLGLETPEIWDVIAWQ